MTHSHTDQIFISFKVFNKIYFITEIKSNCNTLTNYYILLYFEMFLSNIQSEIIKNYGNEVIYNEKYKKVIEKPIGLGSFGVVFLVKNILTDQRYNNLAFYTKIKPEKI